MHDFVTIGTVIGLLLCLIHAAYLTKGLAPAEIPRQ
jgi:hypothetical protein